MLGLKGLATGIGSLPHAKVEDALDLIFKYAPQVPFWPQLPKRDFREGMVAQFIEGLPCLKIKDKGLIFDPTNREEELEKFYDKSYINKDIEYFKISEDFAAGLYGFKKRLKNNPSLLENIKHIKCQITGPFTFAASVNDKDGRALLHDSEFMQAVIEALKMKALWQIKFFEEFGKSIIVFIDEPYLGCFGSAFTPINREDVVEKLREITDKIVSAGKVLSGVHCCGNTDWSIFTDINPPGIKPNSLDIISFDAYSFLDRLALYPQEINRFLQSEAALCWGIVPTQEFKGEETADFLVKKIQGGIDILVKKGVDIGLLKNELFISPSCGLGTLDADKASEIFELLSQTSKEIG